MPGRPRVDPPAVLVRLRAGAPSPRGAAALGRASFLAQAVGVALLPAPELGLDATPDLAVRALQAGVLAIEEPYQGLDLRDAPEALDGPGARLSRTFRFVLPAGADPRAAAAVLAGSAEVEHAEPDAVYHAAWVGGARPGALAPALLPDDPLFADGTQWGLANTGLGPYGGVAGTDIRAPQGWAITTGSSATILGIVDTGFDLHHPELNRDLVDGSPRVLARYNSSVEGEFATTDDSVGHGTIVAGVALALTNNGLQLGSGVAGVCGGGGGDSVGCRVVEVKATPTSYTDALASELGSGIVFAAIRGARAINLSFGGDEDSDNVLDAIAYAASHGAVVVCGAGNGQDDRPQYPGYYARYGLGISVAALKSDGTLARFSSRGPQIDVAAPGEDIMSTYLTYENAYGSPLRDYAASSGTSFAAPFVTGLAGLAYTLQPGMQLNEFQEMLRRTARDVGDPGRDDTYGWGVPDAPALLTALSPPRGFLRGVARAQTWTAVRVDSVILSKNKLPWNGCSIDGHYSHPNRYEVIAHVVLPPGRMLETPEVIVRKAPPTSATDTNGWGPGPLLEYNIGWGEVVPGSATPDGFDVRAYVYDIGRPPAIPCGTSNIGLVPVRPENVYFDWSAFGRLDLPPVVTVDSPAEGAVIDVDTRAQLAFHATDTDTVTAIQVALSLDDGATWTTVANLPGDATGCAFQSPCGRAGHAYRLRFRAVDAHGGWSDQTDVVRAYTPSRVCRPPDLIVDAPADSSLLDVDAPAQFAFHATAAETDTDSVTAIQIAWSENGGANWVTLANLPGTATSYAFQAPCGQAGRNYRLRFRAIAIHGGWSYQTDVVRVYTPSRICLPPDLNVIVPANGSVLDVDVPAQFAFHATDPDTVTAIQLAWSNDGGASWVTVATLPGTATGYGFRVPCGQRGRDYRLRFRVIDARGGWSVQSDVLRSYIPSRVCRDGEASGEPVAFAFLPVTPNPSSGSGATFHFYLPGSESGSAASPPTIRIYDLRGRMVRELVLSASLSGPSSASWDGRDRDGRTAPPGVYLSRLEAGAHRSLQRFVRL